ncbi:DUF645 family protein [Vibrio cholerae]
MLKIQLLAFKLHNLAFEFWQPTSQLLALDVCLRDAFS